MDNLRSRRNSGDPSVTSNASEDDTITKQPLMVRVPKSPLPRPLSNPNGKEKNNNNTKYTGGHISVVGTICFAIGGIVMFILLEQGTCHIFHNQQHNESTISSFV